MPKPNYADPGWVASQGKAAEAYKAVGRSASTILPKETAWFKTGGKVGASLSKTMGGGKLATMAGSNWWLLLPIFLGWYLKKQMRDVEGIQQTNIQTEGIQGMREDISPENMAYQSMMGGGQRGQQDALTQMLLQQIAGGGGPAPLARGEERIGGSQGGRPQF